MKGSHMFKIEFHLTYIIIHTMKEVLQHTFFVLMKKCVHNKNRGASS